MVTGVCIRILQCGAGECVSDNYVLYHSISLSFHVASPNQRGRRCIRILYLDSQSRLCIQISHLLLG